MRQFDTGATRDDADDKLDYEGFLSVPATVAYARYMHKNRLQADGAVRDSDNWQKGIPVEAYMKSMFRHFMDVWSIQRGHEHLANASDIVEALCALKFNVDGMLHEYVQ